jgi:hypothetical protein
MARALPAFFLIVAAAACQSPPASIAACQLVRDPSPHLGKAVTIEDVALPAPGGTIAITAIRGCPIQNIQGIELDLSEAEPESAELLRRNLAEAQRRSRPNNALGVAGRFTGTVDQGFEGALSLRLRRAENQQLRRADDMLQPGLFNAMQAEPDSVYASNTIR